MGKLFNDPLELDRFKEEVNLPDLAFRLGFAKHEKKSSVRTVVMRRPGDSNYYLFFKNQESGHYMFSVPGMGINGDSVLGFMQLICPEFNLGETRKFLRKFINLPEAAPTKLELTKGSPEIDPSYFDFDSLTEDSYGYLQSRGLTKTTIDKSEFKGKVGEKVVDKSFGSRFRNVCFPITDGAQVVGLELKNYEYKGSLAKSAKSHGLWISNIPEDGLIEKLILVESPIDAMSHFQLREDAQGGHIVYASTNGALSKNQMPVINQLLERHSPKQLILAFDNDNAGIRYVITMLGSNMLDQASPGIRFNIKNDEKRYYLNIVLDPNVSSKDQLSPDDLSQFVNKINRNQFHDSDGFYLKDHGLDEEGHKWAIMGLQTPKHLQQMLSIAIDLRPNDIVDIEFPKGKDWNEDLVRLLN